MTSDDHFFLDTLACIPNDILHFSHEVTETINLKVDQAGDALREFLSSASWLPAFARPRRAPQPIPPSRLPIHTPKGFYAWTRDWMAEHTAVTAAIIAFAGTGGWILYRQRRAYLYGKKRRAKRSPAGAKKEVVVIAGTPNSPIPKSLMLDLERRGFIVYVVVSSRSEEDTVRSEGKADILPLHLNVTDPLDVQSTIENFARVFAPSNASQALHLAGFILIPDTHHPSGPVETVPPSLWADSLNTKILQPIATTQAFLRFIIHHHSRLLILTPSIISSLRLPFHAPESTVIGAFEGLTASLTAEMRTLGIDVCHFKLGTFDFGTLAGRQQLQTSTAGEVMAWPGAARAAYARNYIAQQGVPGIGGGLSGIARTGGAKGSPMRELNNAVFDALTQRKTPKRVWRVGRGSWIYEIVGRYVPPGLVGWMMGLRKVEEDRYLNFDSGVDEVRSGSGSAHWEKVERIV